MAAIPTRAYGATSKEEALKPLVIERRALKADDVHIGIQYCGVCHSDIHTIRSEWPGTKYPCVVGHEIVGRVLAVGESVKNFKVGDVVGVGCMVDSCGHCGSCGDGLEQFCENGFTGTYNASPENTYGGYSEAIVVKETFVLRISHKEEDLPRVAPLLCAGITMYSPLRHWNTGPGKKVGIVGLGGLGHMGVKLAHAMGAHVVLFTTSAHKVEDGKRLGADDVVVSTDAAQMAKFAGQLDLIIDTVAFTHELNGFISLLKRDGTLTLVGAPETPNPPIIPFNLIFKRRQVAGSLIGGIRETQDMLDFCAEHNITSDSEIVRMDYINEAYERMIKCDVKYRFVIDMATL